MKPNGNETTLNDFQIIKKLGIPYIFIALLSIHPLILIFIIYHPFINFVNRRRIIWSSLL